jgi:hypothetical protein
MKELIPDAFLEGGNARQFTAKVDQRGVKKRELSVSEIVFEALQRTTIGLVDKNRINDIWSSREWQAAHDGLYSLYLGGMLDDLDEVPRIRSFPSIRLIVGNLRPSTSVILAELTARRIR